MVEVDEGLGSPQPVPKLFPSDDLTRPFEQHRENLKRLFRKSELHAVLSQLAGSNIDLEYAETEADGTAGLWHEWRTDASLPLGCTAPQGRISRNPFVVSDLSRDL